MQTIPISSFHKYWGKKPYFLSKYIISKYTKEWDLILDPFCWSWSLVIDAVLSNRRLVWQDINPISTSINKWLTWNIRHEELRRVWEETLKPICVKLELKYYSDVGGKLIKSFLRTKKDDTINAILLKDWEIKRNADGLENKWIHEPFIPHWWFEKPMISNSRLTVKKNTKVKDYFTDLSLRCHSELLFAIINLKPEHQAFFMTAFTANIANCSKLLPPIKSRWIFAPWAWMTWFYIANEYIENNVFHFYWNRVQKLLKAKQFFEANSTGMLSEGMEEVMGSESNFIFTTGDAKNIQIDSNTVDVIITDPPYWWTVPYLEQSAIWNAFINVEPNLLEEIVISDSKERNKGKDGFRKDLFNAFLEMNRVLKDTGKLILTYNSVSLDDMNKLSAILRDTGFQILNVSNVVQKTKSPRQLNRINVVGWDLLIIWVKSANPTLFEFNEDVLSRLEEINLHNFMN